MQAARVKAARRQVRLRLRYMRAQCVPRHPSCVTACAGWLQRLEVLATLMHARQRWLPTGASGGVAPSEFAAAVAALPSGLLAMVAGSIVKLDSQLRLEARDTLAFAEWARVTAFPPPPGALAPRLRAICMLRARVQAGKARRAELGAHTVAQLKVLCAQRGLRKTGTKAALVARMCDAVCDDRYGPGGEA